MQIRVQILKDLEFRLGPDDNGGALEALRKQVHKISFAVLTVPLATVGSLLCGRQCGKSNLESDALDTNTRIST